jgi:predicted short-subunit dehydrogenase-like oxidoreductase (DUF2520 family)
MQSRRFAKLIFPGREWNETVILSRSMGPTISIVGAGRVGRTLCRRLRELGWTIDVVVTRSRATARSAVRFIGVGRAHGALTRQVLASDLVLIATPDDAIAGVAAALARMGGAEWKGRVALHTSGALDRSVLQPLAAQGAATGSLHPLQTFTSRGTPRLEGLAFAIEGDRRALAMARKIALALGGAPVAVAGRNKPAYHAAGAFVAGHLLAVLEAATQMFMRIGYSRRRAAQALLPLARQMLENFQRHGPRVAWTGPLSRGDFKTMRKHFDALQEFPREFREAYVSLACLGARTLARNPRDVLAKLDHVFREAGGGKS